MDSDKLRKLLSSSRERIETSYSIIDDPNLPISMLIPKKKREKLKKYVKTGSKGIIMYKKTMKKTDDWMNKSNRRKNDPDTGDLGVLLEKYLNTDMNKKGKE